MSSQPNFQRVTVRGLDRQGDVRKVDGFKRLALAQLLGRAPGERLDSPGEDSRALRLLGL